MDSTGCKQCVYEVEWFTIIQSSDVSLFPNFVASLAAMHTLALKEPSYDWRAERDGKASQLTQ